MSTALNSRRTSARGSVCGRAQQQHDAPPELTVCDVMGDWGVYQWSLTLFAMVYSALAGISVVLGPILTPSMAHVCDTSDSSLAQTQNATAHIAWSNFSVAPHECFAPSDAGEQQTIKCHKYIYDAEKFGQMLTNHFDLVCEREWLRSLVSSAALAGMLISSVTLGVFSDKFGRLRCIQLSFAISMLANAASILAHDYYLFSACALLMSYAQVGAANALCTLIMEAVSPRLRFVPVLEYGIGWSLSGVLVPLINALTHNYKLFMAVLLVWQLLMLPWLCCGVFESIRWMLSEGHINRAQIELRRACKMNRVRTDAKLAHKIALIQAQQVRKASRVIEDELAPARLARALENELSTTTQELDMLSAAIKRSFGFDRPDDDSETGAKSCILADLLSPTLARQSFSAASLSAGGDVQPVQPTAGQRPLNGSCASSPTRLSLAPPTPTGEQRNSLTTQALVQLAMKYSKTVQRQEEGSCFLVQMLHRKLWRTTLILALVSIMYESSYYGFVQASKFVGKSVNWNYVLGSVSELLANFAACLMLAYLSRRFSLVAPTLLGVVCCMAMALTYQLIPGEPDSAKLAQDLSEPEQAASLGLYRDQVESLVTKDRDDSASHQQNLTISTPVHTATQNGSASAYELELKQWLNLSLMLVGRFVVCIGIQVSSIIAMESYPNNLRQTGSGAMIFVGRICSMLSPFLFNDTREDKLVLKATLVGLGIIGVLVCSLVPFAVNDNKDKELCDRLNEIEEH